MRLSKPPMIRSISIPITKINFSNDRCPKNVKKRFRYRLNSSQIILLKIGIWKTFTETFKRRSNPKQTVNRFSNVAFNWRGWFSVRKRKQYRRLINFSDFKHRQSNGNNVDEIILFFTIVWWKINRPKVCSIPTTFTRQHWKRRMNVI